MLELAIALGILGMVMGMAFSFLSLAKSYQCDETTEKHQNLLLQSLSHFAIQYDRLPCPADPLLSQGGVEEAQRGQESFVQGTVCKRTKGIIPFRTLGLSESIAKDGYHHWITYAIDEGSNGAPSDVSFPTFCWKKPYSRLVVLEGNGERTAEEGRTSLALPPADPRTPYPLLPDWIAVVLISHGPKGQGAYGVSRNTSLDVSSLEAPNCTPDPGFQGRDAIQSTEPLERRFVSYPRSRSFTHRVRWLTRDQIFAWHSKESCAALRAAHFRSRAPRRAP